MPNILDHWRCLAGTLLAVSVAACGGPQATFVAGETDRDAPQEVAATTVATSWCREGGRSFVAAHYGRDVQFIASHPTSVAAFEAWADTRHGVDDAIAPTGEIGEGEFAVLCVYDGDFSQVPKGPPRGLERTYYTRLSVIATGPGEFRLYEVGDALVMDAAHGPPPPPPGVALPALSED